MANLTLNISFPIVHLNGFRKITSNHNTAASIISFTAYLAGGMGIYIGSFISLATAYIYGGLMIVAGIAIYSIYQLGIVKSEVRQSHSIFLRMFFENIQPVTRHYGAPWGAY
ncbi:MAG: hypothetical protein GY821_16775 [Gammaproteobacteria bacterium]|nr:hypothetical protein [Gammaproteobacteria bacterium]